MQRHFVQLCLDVPDVILEVAKVLHRRQGDALISVDEIKLEPSASAGPISPSTGLAKFGCFQHGVQRRVQLVSEIFNFRGVLLLLALQLSPQAADLLAYPLDIRLDRRDLGRRIAQLCIQRDPPTHHGLAQILISAQPGSGTVVNVEGLIRQAQLVLQSFLNVMK